MELRLQSKQAIGIQVSDDCTLHNLKQTLLQTLASSLPPDSLHLSLNGRDDLEESSPEISLRSLGINSGDLVFFTLNRTIEQSQSIDSDLEKLRLQDSELVPKNCPKSILLNRVMKEELGHGRRNAHQLLVVAAHAVLLDSGLFSIARIDMPDDWPSTPSTVAIQYAIGEPYTMNEVVLLRFRSVLQAVLAFESIDFRRGSEIYPVTLDVKTFGPNLDSIWANSMSSDKIIDESEWNDIERKMCEFWKVVKDGLVLPIFMILPHDMMLKIVKFLSGVDIAKLQCVCTELRDLGNNEDLWRLKLNQEFSSVVIDPQNERSKQKFEECHRNRMNMMIAMNMEQEQEHEQEPPHPNFVHRESYAIWQTYISPPWPHLFPPNPWPIPFAPAPFQHAFGGAQNAFYPHPEWPWHGRGQNNFYPHHGLQGRGRGQSDFNLLRGLQGRGRGRGRGR